MGELTFNNEGDGLGSIAQSIGVYRFDPSAEGDSRFDLIPNVVCQRVERQIGPHPSTAHFRYLLDDSGMYPEWPSDFGQIFPQDAESGPYVVATDDRIAVLAWDAEGNSTFLFDGYAQIPQVDLSPDSQTVTFTATGVEIRCWDFPISGRLQRDAGNTTDSSGSSDFWTNVNPRFNPSDGKGGLLPNCTTDGMDLFQDQPNEAFPTFLEEHLERDPDPRTKWTVSKAIRYILSAYNDGHYVDNPNMDDITRYVVIKVANPPDGTIDPTDASTYTTKDLVVRDLDIQNKAWPDVLEELLRMVGFGFFFTRPEDPGDDSPTVGIWIFRIDQSDTDTVSLLLDAPGSELDPTRNDVTSLSLARDLNSVANAFAVETRMKRYEVSIVLAPAFTPTPGDEVGGNRKQFKRSNLAGATSEILRKYRWYVADECGDGHYDLPSQTYVKNQPIDLTPVFPDDENGNPTYVQRYREGATKLISLDEQQHPRKATLHYSQDYAGTAPAVWDGTGTWKIVKDWQLLENRLGIECTADDPENWTTGEGKKNIHGVTWQAKPTTAGPGNNPPGTQFFLLLTTVIEGDWMLTTSAPKRIASPTQFSRWRLIDAKDHYQYNVVWYPSMLNQDSTTPNGDTPGPLVVRDDTDTALDLARQYRTAHEMPPLAGSATVPYLTTYFELADLVESIDGRDVSLHTNAATNQGEGRRFPFVTKVSWGLDGNQTTQLHMTDLRAEPRARNQ